MTIVRLVLLPVLMTASPFADCSNASRLTGSTDIAMTLSLAKVEAPAKLRFTLLVLSRILTAPMKG
jgi:hypothetical protein